MYTTVIDDEDYAIKPMNCPGGVLVYKSEPRSYRDLPLRMGELGLVHRHEKSGQLHGLMRVRCFTQDDAHIFMTPEQIKDEIKGVANLIDEVYNLFGFKYHVELSTRPEDSMGSDEDWEMATEGLRGALDDLGLDYVVNEGDGAFYGPKIDFHLEDSIGRTWQCGTIQLDFQLPQRFELEYTGADGEKHRPIMIHRVVYGSIERFIGILIEHFAGAFPTWLAPVQVKVLPISDKYADYGKKVLDALHEAGIRAEMDTRSEKIGYKIREAQVTEDSIHADRRSKRGRGTVLYLSEAVLQVMKAREAWSSLSQISKKKSQAALTARLLLKQKKINKVGVKKIDTYDTRLLRTSYSRNLQNIRTPLIFLRKMATYSCFGVSKI